MTLACLPPVAGASSYSVTNTSDSGEGSLRAAIAAANGHSGEDGVQIEVSGTIALATELPSIQEDLGIVGPGADNLTVRRSSSAAPFRIFEFLAAADGSLTGLTVADGIAATGGGISNESGSLTLTRVAVVGNEATQAFLSSVLPDGGGIYSLGPLTLSESVVSGNRATASEGIFETKARGGGIFALGELTIDRSTVSGNVAEAITEDGEIFSRGGGIYAAQVKIANSTISGNSALAEGGTAPEALGGGFLATGFGHLTSVTVTGNSASATQAAGANLHLQTSGLLRNSIVSAPGGSTESCSGFPGGSGGFNLDEDGSCGLETATDLAEVVAGLDPLLKLNGGPTPTHALLAGSPALDRGSAFGSPIDQRGLPRPSDFASIGNAEGGDGSDI
ncbi:MAG TPA: choice-of-anchor Q domain-containing protein, partial [Solirubrobacterales bacterium]|nr:choice-of-anchor Q domain-containing protein [Solirubrobacterales bacterium]